MDSRYECTLDEADATARLDADRALARRVIRTERSGSGLRVIVSGGDEGRRLVDTFVANESRCCSFFDFSVAEDDTTVTLEITAPADPVAQELVDLARQTFERGPDTTLPLIRSGGDGGSDPDA